MDKAEKKKLQQSYRQKEKQVFIDSLPMSPALFSQLFDVLDDKLEEQDCSHTLEMTIGFLEGKGIAADKVVEWLEEHGGYCDCEVLANVEDLF